MPAKIEDYAVIGNCETMALVARDGSIDWLGLPRFDSPACFAALLGELQHGRWLIAPDAAQSIGTRRYRGDTMILETSFDAPEGRVCVTDFMSRRDGVSDVIRIVRGLAGQVRMRTELIVRFDYGSVMPWVWRREDGRLDMIAGPDRLTLDTDVELHGEQMRTIGTFDIAAGETKSFVLSWSVSYDAEPQRLDPIATFHHVDAFWRDWSAQFKPRGIWDEPVLRSLLTLKALSHWQTGGIVAAGTTSLPEKIGGARNWDYRFCWLRDSTLTLYALIGSGYLVEAKAWRGWLIRAVGGSPDQLQIMYGVAGERRLVEYELPWLPGYEGSKPVRVGNAAADQVQLDVYGEVLDTLYAARRAGLATEASGWALECALVAHLETIWDQPDDGIWEVRSGRKHFTHSKVMAWVALDRAVRSAEEFGLDAPLEHWRALRETIHADVCARGFDAERGSFVQYYGSKELDASLLMIPLVGFLPATDPRVHGTVNAIEHELLRDGFVLRYDTTTGTDGLAPGEGAFLACSFWLVDTYILQGRLDDAEAMFTRLLDLANDVGLLAEEYDVATKRQVGNFPQAFSHLALISSARNLANALTATKQGTEPALQRNAD